MTPDEIQDLEADLKQREEALASRDQELARLSDNKAKDAITPIDNNPPAPSTFVHSIKTYIPITLDLKDSNYAQWCELFLIALGRYGLTAHVQGTDTGPSDTSPSSVWGLDDFTILNWIYGSISLEIFIMTTSPGASARQVWTAIYNLFCDNKESRALALDAEFHNAPYGDMTVHEYCAKLKSLADALADVGQPITDNTLVLTVLRGLNKQYSYLRSFLPYQVPFPTFLQTQSALVLEESQHKNDAKNDAATMLWVSGNSILPSAGGERPPSGGGGRGRGFGDAHPPGSFHLAGGGRGFFNNTRGRGHGGCGHGRSEPWMFNPWTGLPTRAQLQHQPGSTPWQP
jgi:hypothetical protein